MYKVSEENSGQEQGKVSCKDFFFSPSEKRRTLNVNVKPVWGRQKEAKDWETNDVLLLKGQSDNSEETRNGVTSATIFKFYGLFKCKKRGNNPRHSWTLFKKSVKCKSIKTAIPETSWM